MEREGTDQRKEIIRFMTEWLKIVAAIFVVTFGGFVSLIVKGVTGKEIVFCVIGLLVIVFLLMVSYRLNREIRKLIDKL